jgi:hypothetical protein
MNEIVGVCILLTISPSSNHLQSSFPSAILVFGGWLNSSLFFRKTVEAHPWRDGNCPVISH